MYKRQGLSVVFSGCKKDDEEKQLPVGSLTNANFYGSWVSTDVPGTTQYMDFVEQDVYKRQSLY